MKQIEPISIWDKGINKTGSVLNVYAVNVSLDKSATFWYGIYSKKEDETINELLTQGNVVMDGESYDLWTSDDIAWNFIAAHLNLIINGVYVQPTPMPTPTPTVIE